MIINVNQLETKTIAQLSKKSRFEGASASESKYVCYICKNEKKLTEQELRLHFRKVHGDKKLRVLKLHKENSLKCDICSKYVRTMKGLKEHMENHSSEFNCDKCDISFKKIVDYTIHLRLHSDEDVFKCILCEFETDSINEISQHLGNAHGNDSMYTCRKCQKCFYIKSWYDEHNNYHSGARPFRCTYCAKQFAYSRYLTIHQNNTHKDVLVKTPKGFECVICRKLYQRKCSLKVHMNVHTGNLPICDICGKLLTSKEHLKFHMRIHTGFKPFVCSYCGKGFTIKPRLIEHERVHTGVKPYACEYCSKSFTQRSSLTIHVRGHTGEKPYVCHICKRGFAARAILNNHFKTCKGYE